MMVKYQNQPPTIHAQVGTVAFSPYHRPDPSTIHDPPSTPATHFELQVVGGAGYVTESPTARRLREASFLPVQSPIEGHLRYELARYDYLENLRDAL